MGEQWENRESKTLLNFYYADELSILDENIAK